MNRKSKFLLGLSLVLILTMAISSMAMAAASPTGATIVSDLADYNPGATVNLTGTGWAASEAVHIFVNDSVGNTWSLNSSPDPVADGSGNLAYSFQLPNTFVANYSVTATGPVSGTATASFTDANSSADLDQCANDPAPSPSTDGCDTNANQWVNGNLGASKALYFEGDSIPYRMRFDNLTLSSHTVTIEWDTTKSGTHALDYIDSFNQSVLDANPCLGVSGCSPSTFTTFPIPADPQVTGAGVTPIAGVFTFYGATITNVSAYSYANGAGFTGDKSARITVTFTPSVANPVLAWGGHISTRKDWGLNSSAVAIPGSPYHTRLIDLDGSGGNQDRSLSADAVIFPGSITIVKDAQPNGSTSFPYTASPTPLANFSLVDDGTSTNTKVFSNITSFQTYTVVEGAVTNWNLTSLTCSVTSPNGGSSSTNLATGTATINMAEGENYTCTYTNVIQTGTLTVIKHVVNDNGGTATAGDWSLHVKSGANEVSGSPQAGSESGTIYTLVAGSYAASETGGPSGYTFDGFSGDCDSSGNVTVVAGQNKTCTLTNNDQQAYVTVVKVVNNNNGGTAKPDDFNLTLGGNAVTSGTKVAVNPGTYTAGETQLSGYSFDGFSGDCDSSGSVTVALGQSKTCTLTNSDQPAYVIVNKVVVNDNGGSAQPNDFKLTLNGNSVNSGDKSQVTPGTYTAAETQLSGYTFTGFSGDCDSSGKVTVALGETKTCTLTNDDQPASITVVKVVNNKNGGTAVADDFKLTLNGNSVTSGTKVAVTPGTYTAGETLLSGYQFDGFSGDCDSSGKVTVALGENKTCTLTNSDLPAFVIVNKVVVNDNGGSAQPNDFKLTLGGNGVLSGAKTQVTPGTYTAGETQLSGYTFTGFSGDCDSSGSVTVALGETKTCTLTNDDQQATITVVKVVNNNNGGTAQPNDFNLTLNNNSVTSGVAVPVSPGTYTAGETLLSGYKFDGFTGDCDTSGKVTVALGESKTCTLTNSDQPSYVIVKKVVVNDSGGTAQPNDFKLTLNGNSVLSGDKTQVTPGTYTANETQLAGYTFVSFSGDCDSSGSVTVGLGETKTCTLTNDDQQAYVIVNKVVVNDNGGTLQVGDFPLTLDGKSVNSGDKVAVNPGSHTAAETQQYGYSFTGFSGDCDSSGSVTVALGETKSCTLTNDDQPGTIVVIKSAKPNSGSFAFTTTGDGYQGFTLNLPGTTQNSQTLNAGSYTVKEGTQLGWVLTGIGGSTDPNTPYNCVVTGKGGSTGVGDLNTETATITLKNGDTVTCTFQNTGVGATRTQGFWATHPQLADIAWFGGTAFGHTFPGVAGVSGIGDTTLCGRSIDTLDKLMGGFWSDISKTTAGKKRSSLDQARMQLLQQLLAAELNASAFGSAPSKGSFAAWEAAYCGTDLKAISTAQQQAASFNSQGDSSTFTPGTSADSKTARSTANKKFWDVLP